MGNDKVFNYTIVMKNGAKYNVNSDKAIADFMKMILPRYKDDTIVTCFTITDIPNKMVAVTGSEVSSVEYDVNWDFKPVEIDQFRN